MLCCGPVKYVGGGIPRWYQSKRQAFSESPRCARFICVSVCARVSPWGPNGRFFLTRSHNDPTREGSEPKNQKDHSISGWVERILVPQPDTSIRDAPVSCGFPQMGPLALTPLSTL